MAIIWLVGFDDDGPQLELQRAGHEVVRHDLQSALAGTSEAADVGLVCAVSDPVTLVRRLSLHAPTTTWVILAGKSAAEQVAALLDAGASDVCIDPLAEGAATPLVVRLLRDRRARARLGFFEERASRASGVDEVVGDSPLMRELLEQVSRITRRSALGPPVRLLLTGETGTGKGLLARRIHFSSRRRDGAFIDVNCAALPGALLESELFGHERGAFTDAKTARIGLIEAADGGTLFLDEISYLSPEGQAKLLTVLDHSRVRRLGGNEARAVDVQVIAASSHDIPKLVPQGKFLPELFHRLSSLWLKLPPLHARGDDALVIAERLLQTLTARYRLPSKHLSEGARAAIRSHRWPGNVRELSNAMERAVLAEEGEVVEASELTLHPVEPQPTEVEARAGGGVRVSLPHGGVSLDEVERAVVLKALQLERGNVTRAAALLRTTRDTLRWRIDKHAITEAEWGE